MMKNRTQTVYPSSVFGQSTAPIIYVTDFSERTHKARGVELHDQQPTDPNCQADMDCLKIYNPSGLSVDYNIFDDCQFKRPDGKMFPHCECTLFPTINDETSWVSFVEIKDCKPKNLAYHKAKAKNQLISTVTQFKTTGILSKQKIYGIVSFPRKGKTNFNQALYDDCTEYKRLFHEHRIHYYLTNQVFINDNKTLSIVK